MHCTSLLNITIANMFAGEGLCVNVHRCKGVISHWDSTAIDSQVDRCKRHAGHRWQCAIHCWLEELIGVDNRDIDILKWLACLSECIAVYGNTDSHGKGIGAYKKVSSTQGKSTGFKWVSSHSCSTKAPSQCVICLECERHSTLARVSIGMRA